MELEGILEGHCIGELLSDGIMNFEKQNKELLESLRIEGIKDKAILNAMEKIPRHLFVGEENIGKAYTDRPLSIGYGATISQPYTVAFMLEKLELKKGLNVLEVGTGSGWNASLIAYIINPGKVYTTEIVPELSEFAKKNIDKVNIKNIEIIQTKELGYRKAMPYDRIIVTAASKDIPQELTDQLKDNGIMLIPVDSKYENGYQDMIKVRKFKDRIEKEDLKYTFLFVPLKS